MNVSLECDERHPRICQYFSLYGNCKYENHCAYIHELPCQSKIDTLWRELSLFNEIFHPKTKICRKLHLHILFEPMFFIFFKNVSTSSGSISGQKMWLRWPVFRAPMASILGSKVQYSKLRGQYFRLQGQYFELHGQYFSSIGSTLAPGSVP